MTAVVRLGARAAPHRVEVLDHPRGSLVGAALRWKRYRRWTVTRPLGSCEFCSEPFTEGGTPGLNSGYSVVGGGPAGQDDYVWICAVCYETRRDSFCWTVLDTRGNAAEPPDLLGTVFDLTWTALADSDGYPYDRTDSTTTPLLRNR